MRGKWWKLVAAVAVLGIAAGLWLLGDTPRKVADAPLGMPAQGTVDLRLDWPDELDSAQTPLAVRFGEPIGQLVYNAQKFWEMNEKRGGHHTGDDLNGIGGMNTDLGDPVFAAADGLVIYAADPSPGWGNMVILAHRLPDGRRLESMYAHLSRIDVKRGDLVARGSQIAAVGTANGYYPAHLHFEIREADSVDIGGGYAMEPLNHVDPVGTVAVLRNAAADDFSPSPLGAR